MNIEVQPQLPMPGVPDVLILEKVRRGMAGCASCLGIGDYVGTGEEFGGGGVVPASGGYGSGNFLQDLTRGTLSIVSSILTPPTYRTATTPSGSLTEIRAGGALAYPGQVPSPQPSVGTLSTTTLILLAAGLFAIMSMRGR